MNFIEIVNRIFIDKESYSEISDDDKINAFFIINRKFGKQFPDISRKFNHVSIDKSSSIDLWFNFFKDVNRIPQWYWDPKDRQKKTKSTVKKSNYEYIKKREDMKDSDMEYLEKYFEEDLKVEMKKLNKFEI